MMVYGMPFIFTLASYNYVIYLFSDSISSHDIIIIIIIIIIYNTLIIMKMMIILLIKSLKNTFDCD